MQIIGHRGARGEAPENTLSGFKYLKSLGIFAVELDIQISSDGYLIVHHNNDSLHQLNLKQIQQLNFRHDSSNQTIATQIPTLSDVFKIINDFEQIQLEVKVYQQNTQQLHAIAQQLAVLYTSYPTTVIVTSFNHSFLAWMQQQYPYVTRGLLVENDTEGQIKEDWNTNNIIITAQKLACTWILPHYSILLQYQDLITTAHQQGLKVSTWTVNEPSRMIELRDMGLDSLITDYPTLALQTLTNEAY